MGQELTEPGGGVRLYVEAPLGEHATVILGTSQAHYVLNVMRAEVGDRLRLFNGRDGEWRATIHQTAKRTCTVMCEILTVPQREVPDLWLVFAPVKKTPADYLVQKATELGVRLLQPVSTQRTIVSRVNLDRMRSNTIEAAEQSGRVDVPEIREFVALERLLANWPAERRILFCDEAGQAPVIADALHNAPPGPWAVLTGPEGGFAAAERARMLAMPNVVPVSLGERILRADTAALSALAVWQAITGDWRNP